MCVIDEGEEKKLRGCQAGRHMMLAKRTHMVVFFSLTNTTISIYHTITQFSDHNKNSRFLVSGRNILINIGCLENLVDF